MDSFQCRVLLMEFCCSWISRRHRPHLTLHSWSLWTPGVMMNRILHPLEKLILLMLTAKLLWLERARAPQFTRKSAIPKRMQGILFHRVMHHLWLPGTICVGNVQFSLSQPPEPENIWFLRFGWLMPSQTKVMKCILQQMKNVRGVVLEAHGFPTSSTSCRRWWPLRGAWLLLVFVVQCPFKTYRPPPKHVRSVLQARLSPRGPLNLLPRHQHRPAVEEEILNEPKLTWCCNVTVGAETSRFLHPPPSGRAGLCRRPFMRRLSLLRTPQYPSETERKNRFGNGKN